MEKILIRGLVKRSIPILKDEKLQSVELGFFFGTLTFRLIKNEIDLDLTEIDKKVESISKDPLNGLNFVIDFLFLAHKAWQMLNQAKPLIEKTALWFSIEQMGPEDFAGILQEGLEAYGSKEEEVTEEEEEESKKKINEIPKVPN
jgi:hypothetical protein